MASGGDTAGHDTQHRQISRREKVNYEDMHYPSKALGDLSFNQLVRINSLPIFIHYKPITFTCKCTENKHMNITLRIPYSCTV